MDAFKIISLHQNCEYIRVQHLFRGKRVTVEDGSDGRKWVSFVFADDAKPINKFYGWSDSKNRYLLHNPKLELVVRKKKIPSEWMPLKGEMGLIYERNCRGVVRLIKK